MKSSNITIIGALFFVLMSACTKVNEQAEQNEPSPTEAAVISGILASRVQTAENEFELHSDALFSDEFSSDDDTVSSGIASPSEASSSLRLAREATDRENYVHFEDSSAKQVSEHPVSTFSIDVDTGSYANVRRMLNSGHLPRTDAVRVEEMINYFAYDYPVPKDLSQPFTVTTELAPTPWNTKTQLLHIGIKGYELPPSQRRPANLVFLVDVSGSMQQPGKLDLVKSALKLLSKQMTKEDRISVAVYAGAAGVVLEPTPGNETAKIVTALEMLTAGGSTNGGAGIRLAYNLAEQVFMKDGINRVILATDGDFNVGNVNFEALKDLVEDKRKTGIALTTLGFGAGNYNDYLMEQFADACNGNYAYIDTLNEAQKVLVEELSATLQIIAKDVKIQIEFNPAVVAEYRLIGYENRILQREDFNNDKVDAGEIGAGHSVTALYEVALTESEYRWIEPLRYGAAKTIAQRDATEMAFLRVRYKSPSEDKSKLQEWPLEQDNIAVSLNDSSETFRFAAAVAAFGQVLRGGKYTDAFGYPEIMKLARQARGDDTFGYRGEFVKLVSLAQSVSAPTRD